MAEIIKIPALNMPPAKTRRLVLHKTKGDFVGTGDLLADLMTDFGKTEIKSPFEGFLLHIIDESDILGSNYCFVAIIGSRNENIDELKNSFTNNCPQKSRTSQENLVPKNTVLNRKHHTTVLICCLIFTLSNIFVPFLLGDVYPFTIAPMFRDTPLVYANYRVYSPEGTKLADNSRRESDPVTSPDPFKLRRYYDGNPVGCGVGICPPKTLGDFGYVHSEDEVRNHIKKHWPDNLNLPYIEIEQEIVGPLDAQKVGIQKIMRWRVNRPKTTNTQND